MTAQITIVRRTSGTWTGASHTYIHERGLANPADAGLAQIGNQLPIDNANVQSDATNAFLELRIGNVGYLVIGTTTTGGTIRRTKSSGKGVWTVSQQQIDGSATVNNHSISTANLTAAEFETFSECYIAAGDHFRFPAEEYIAQLTFVAAEPQRNGYQVHYKYTGEFTRSADAEAKLLIAQVPIAWTVPEVFFEVARPREGEYIPQPRPGPDPILTPSIPLRELF